MVPNNTYADTQYKPIGLVASWTDNKAPLTEKIYSANPGPFTSACCAKYVLVNPLHGLSDMLADQKTKKTHNMSNSNVDSNKVLKGLA